MFSITNERTNEKMSPRQFSHKMSPRLVLVHTVPSSQTEDEWQPCTPPWQPYTPPCVLGSLNESEFQPKKKGCKKNRRKRREYMERKLDNVQLIYTELARSVNDELVNDGY